MSFEAVLKAHLLADAAIAAALADATASESRYYPLVRPQGQKNLDAIVYQLITGVPETNLEGGSSGLERKRIQLTIIGSDYDAAKALAELVKVRLSSASADGEIKPGTIQGERDDFDFATREAYVVLDYSIHYTPASPVF